MLPGIGLAALLLTPGTVAPPANPISLTNENASKTKTDGTAATASFTFNTDRTVKDQDGVNLDAAWISAGYTVGDYSIRVTVNSGTTPAGTIGSWLALSSARTWSLTDAAGAAGTKTCSLKVEIRETASGTILDTATYTLTADSQASGGGTVFTPVPGTYSDTGVGTAELTVTASASVVWTWTYTGNNPGSTIASGGSGTSITFSIAAPSISKSSSITLHSGANTWTLNLTANVDEGGGAVMTL
jgi:hypothetical protein